MLIENNGDSRRIYSDDEEMNRLVIIKQERGKSLFIYISICLCGDNLESKLYTKFNHNRLYTYVPT